MPGRQKPVATSTVYHHRARIAGLSRDRAPDDPELVDARRDLRAQKLADHIARAVSEAPPLTDEQRARLAGLLTGGAA